MPYLSACASGPCRAAIRTNYWCASRRPWWHSTPSSGVRYHHRGGESLTNPVPAVIPDLQFAQACAQLGALTWQEAEDWVATGAIPAMLLAVTDKIADPATRARTRAIIRSAKECRRHSATTIALGHALGWTDPQIDGLFRLAAVL